MSNVPKTDHDYLPTRWQVWLVLTHTWSTELHPRFGHCQPTDNRAIRSYYLLSYAEKSDTYFHCLLSDSQYVEPKSQEETAVVLECTKYNNSNHYRVSQRRESIISARYHLVVQLIRKLVYSGEQIIQNVCHFLLKLMYKLDCEITFASQPLHIDQKLDYWFWWTHYQYLFLPETW